MQPLGERLRARTRRLLPGLPLLCLATLLFVGRVLGQENHGTPGLSGNTQRLEQPTSQATSQLGVALVSRATLLPVPRTVEELAGDAMLRVSGFHRFSEEAEVVLARPMSTAELRNVGLGPFALQEHDGDKVLVVVRGDFDSPIYAPLRPTAENNYLRAKYVAFVYHRWTGGVAGTIASPDGEWFRSLLPGGELPSDRATRRSAP